MNEPGETAGELSARFSHAWPTTTRHLRVLLDAGLVTVTPAGRERHYQLPMNGWVCGGSVVRQRRTRRPSCLTRVMTARALLILHEKCNKPAVEREWIEWHREVHEPDIVATGAEHVTFWQLSAKPEPGMPGLGFSHVTIAEYATDDVPPFPQSLAMMRANDRVHEAHTVVDCVTYLAHGAWNRKPAPDQQLRGHILAQVMPNDPAREVEWDEWYDHEHVPDMLASGAFTAATRWRRVSRRSLGADFVTLYDVSLPSIDEAVARSAAVMPGIVAAGRKHPAHTGALTLTLVRA